MSAVSAKLKEKIIIDAPKLIDKKIAELTDWRGKKMARLRKVILGVNSGISEEYKWSTPVFTHNGNVCALGIFKDHIKVNFFPKAQAWLIPRSCSMLALRPKTSRIDLHEDDKIDEIAFRNLVKAAVSLNKASKK